jgi:radical SAM protein with 4Fe4S-binding SPASM domain
VNRPTVRQALNKLVSSVETRFQLPVVRSLPQEVDVVLTKACNLACTFCKDYETEGARRVSVANFEKAARQLFPTARWVSFCSGGEPYLHKGLEELLRIARRYRVTTWVLSNGMLLTEDRLRPIVREGLISLHGFSVDGARPATVERLRVGARFDVIVENVRTLLRVRRQEGRAEPGVVIRYALLRSNVEELPEAVRLWGEMGVSAVTCNFLSLCNGIDRQESLYFHQDLMTRVFAEARRAAERYPGLKLTLPRTVREQLPLRRQPQQCLAPWRFVKIDTNGKVLPCHRAYEALSMGEVYGDEGESFQDVWNSPGYQALRRTVNDDGVEKHYGYCSRCELRYGWGDVSAHLGDETWLAALAERAPEKALAIDHRRRR